MIPIEQFIKPDGTTQLCCGNCGYAGFIFLGKGMGSVCSNCRFPIVDPNDRQNNSKLLMP